jgi:hypothetical protein
MTSQQLNFYATYSDIRPVLEQFEAAQQVTYVRTGLFDSTVPQTFESYQAINSLSVSVDGDANHVPGYLIVTDPRKIKIREVPQRTGATKFAIDQSLIPDSLYFQSGGIFSNVMLVPGRLGIAYQTGIAKSLFDTFAKIVRREFRKVKSYYVGREAYVLCKGGLRLGLSLRANPNLDLKLQPD